MPGYVKVSGQQRPVAVPHIKVSGQWKPVAIGWVKVAGQWRIWHTAEIEDNFDRANSGTLGTASNDFSEWTTLSGTWEIDSNRAKPGSTAGPHLASVPLYKATNDVTVELDTPDNSGIGVGFWIQDAGNWHAVVPGVRSQFNPSYYYCADPTYTLNGSICRKITTQEASYEGPYQVDPPPYQSPIYGCATGNDDLFGSTCYTTSTYAASCSGGGTTYTCNTPSTGGSCTYIGGGQCTCTQTSYQTYNLNFIECGPCSGSQIVRSSSSCSSGLACFEYDYYCVCYGQDVGAPPCGGETCEVTRSATASTSPPVCSCPNGGDLVGDVCYVTTSYPATVTGYETIDPAPYTEPGRGYYCPSGYVLNGTLCTLTETQSAIFVPSSTTYPAVMRAYKSVSGVISEIFSQDIPGDPRSIKVTTSGTNVSIRTYASAGLVGQTASLTFNAGNSVQTTNVGLVKYGNQIQRQGVSVDNFRAE